MALTKSERVKGKKPQPFASLSMDLCHRVSNLENFLAKQKLSPATDYLKSVISNLKLPEDKLMMEMHWLIKLASFSYIDEIPTLFRQYLSDFTKPSNEDLTNINYLIAANDYLLDTIYILARNIDANTYPEVVLTLYDAGIDYFSKFSIPFANNLLLLKGDLLKNEPEKSLQTYQLIFSNLFLLTLDKDYIPSNLEFMQLIEALDKVASHPQQLKKKTLNTLIQLLKNNEESKISTHFVGMAFSESDKNYSLYQQLNYIFEFLLFLTKFDHDTGLSPALRRWFSKSEYVKAYIAKLRQKISIFKAIDDNELLKFEALLAISKLDLPSPGLYTPLQYAIKKQNPEFVRLLLKNGAKTGTFSEKVPLPIYLAIQKNNPSILKLLLKKNGARINVTSKTYGTPLFYALMQSEKHLDTPTALDKSQQIKKLLSVYGAKFNEEEKKKINTPDSPEHALFRKFADDFLFPKALTAPKAKQVPNIYALTRYSGKKVPIFCPHALDGTTPAYTKLATAIRAIDKDRDVFGIESPAIYDGKAISSIHEMAKQYVESIKIVEPLGPYFLFGWSFGGLLVFEMASILMKQGEKVTILGLLDTLGPNLLASMSKEKYAHHIFEVSKQLSAYWDNSLEFSIPTIEQLQLLDKAAQNSCVIPSPDLVPDSLGESGDALKKMLTILRTNLDATLNYQPLDQETPLVTCYNTSASVSFHDSPSLGWGEMAGVSINAYLAGEGHFDILKNPALSTEMASVICNHPEVEEADRARKKQTDYTDYTKLRDGLLRKLDSYSDNPYTLFNKRAAALTIVSQCKIDLPKIHYGSIVKSATQKV